MCELTARHDRGTAWARHDRGTAWARHDRGTAWARHAMCKSALRWKAVAYPIMLRAFARCRLRDQQRVLRHLGQLLHSVM